MCDQCFICLILCFQWLVVLQWLCLEEAEENLLHLQVELTLKCKKTVVCICICMYVCVLAYMYLCVCDQCFRLLLISSVAGSATVNVSRSGRGKSVTSASGANPQMHGDSGVYVCLFVCVCVCVCVSLCIYLYIFVHVCM